MKRLLAALVLCLALSPAWGQESPAEGDGPSLMEEGARLLLRGLLAEMEPAIDDMGKALSGVKPALRELQPRMMELLALVDDLANYQAPERLENGDILIRRKPGAPLPPPLPDATEPLPQTDL